MQARQELQEAQRQLQELEKQERDISATDKTRAQECRRKIAAAQSKVQVLLPFHLFLSGLLTISALRYVLHSKVKTHVFSGSQSTSKGHRPSRQPPRSERTASFRAGAKCSEYEAAAGAAAEETSRGKSAETSPGDGDATKDSQSKGTPDRTEENKTAFFHSV